MRKIFTILRKLLKYLVFGLKRYIVNIKYKVPITRGQRKMAGYQLYSLKRFRAFCLPQVEGKKVLEVGSDVDGHILSELAMMGVKRIVGINNAKSIWSGKQKKSIKLADNATLIDADARWLPFEDEEFDTVVSIAVFEHINGLNESLKEMYRVLKPGGYVYSYFGPIWSSALGHHLYAVTGEEEARFWKPEKNPLPDFAHLFMGPDEMGRFLSRVVSEEMKEEIIAWVYKGNGINRLFYNDYVRIFSDSPFMVEKLTPFTQWIDPDMEELLKGKFGEDNFYSCNAMEVVLKKPDR